MATINEAPSRVILRGGVPLLKVATPPALRNEVVVRFWTALLIMGQVTLLMGMLVLLQDLLSVEFMAFSPRDLALAGEFALVALLAQYIFFGFGRWTAKPAADPEQSPEPEPPEAG